MIKTEGIIIKQTKFSDSGVIVKIFTREMGIQSFFVRGLRKSKSGKKTALFQPLTIVDLVVNYNEKKSLQSIKEINLNQSYKSLTIHPIKRSLLFFIDELLHKCLKEETENNELFDWIKNSLIWLDLTNDDFVNFHLVFMMQLSMFMGFFPKDESTTKSAVFDMVEGKFLDRTPHHPHFVSGDTATIIRMLQSKKFNDTGDMKIDNRLRKIVLETMIAYYDLHIPSLGEFKSLDVLSVVLQ